MRGWTPAEIAALAARGMVRDMGHHANGNGPGSDVVGLRGQGAAGDASAKWRCGIASASATTPAAAENCRVLRAGPAPSKWEAAYRAEILEPLRLAGEIGEPVYEGLRFRLGPGAYYTPDWVSPLPGGRWRADEVKGHMREAARVRLLAASEKYPAVEWWIARRRRAKDGGGWVVQRIGGPRR